MPASSPTGRLLIGLAATLLAVAVFSWYALRQIDGLRRLQTETIDRNRKDSLQLLRIQNNLHSLGLAMRDMRERDARYPLEAWNFEFDRVRQDLDDALRVENLLAPSSRTPGQQRHLSASLEQFWVSGDRVFALAKEGKPKEARRLLGTSLQPQQAAITATVARFLVMNNEAEQEGVLRIQQIYDRVEDNIYYFQVAMLIATSLIGLYLIHANRRIFQRLAALSDQRRVLARKVISVQEEILRSVSRELHDEFGQILTAVGAMLSRAEKKGLPPDSPFRDELQEVKQTAQAALERMRAQSHVLHPAILDDYGLEKALEWYLPQFEKQTGITVRYEKQGSGPALVGGVSIHVFRILQEALTNVARHSKSTAAWVRIRFASDRLHLEVEDRGVGLPEEENAPRARGMGLVAMRERAELLQGQLKFRRPPEGGTLLSLDIPLAEALAP